jgi:glycosyltransferase involved in cell wall biosynthesis
MMFGKRILILSQVFWPDSSAVSQVMTDLAEELSRRRNRVEVFSSRFAYENPKVRFDAYEEHGGIRIRRLWQTVFAKTSRGGRLLNFLTFNISLLISLFAVRKGKIDLIIGTTVPPLSSFFGAVVARVKKIPFAFWAMDLQPELAITAGYIRKNGLSARILAKMSDVSMSNSDLIVSLDRFMTAHIKTRLVKPVRIVTHTLWPAMDKVNEGERLDNSFRKEHGLSDKIVIMYSGNMSVMHPLDTLLRAAGELRADDRFLFLFIGGGVRKLEVAKYQRENHLANIRLLPLQDRARISISLGAADLQAVVLGDGCVGLTHPNKIYGAMFIGKPILYIGPRPSHITEILDSCPGNISVPHGSTEELVRRLKEFASRSEEDRGKVGRSNREYGLIHFSAVKLKEALVSELLSVTK